MCSLKSEKGWNAIRIGEWTLRETHSGRWKVSGPHGGFTLHEVGGTRWRYIFGNAQLGTQRRETFDAVGVEDALHTATKILFPKPTSPVADKKAQIEEVLDQALSTCHGEPYHCATLKKHAGYFKVWCRLHHLRYWEQLQITQIREYAHYQLARGCSRKTVLHYLEPIRLTARWAMEVCPEESRLVFDGLKLPPKAGLTLRYSQRKARTYLPLVQVVEFLDWLRSERFPESLRAGIALQGLCGLQLQEALRLTWDRVDLARGTIVIEEDRRHDPAVAGVKNEYRVRCLPLPELVLQILCSLKARVPHTKGRELVVRTPNSKAYAHRVTRALYRWKADVRLAPKDLRNTLPTEAEKGKWMSVWVRRYFGHAPATIMERAYLAEQEADVGIAEGQDLFVERLRKEVVSHIDAEVEKCKKLHSVPGENVVS